MSEKRFKSTLDEDTMSIMPYLVSDNEECFYNLEGCVDLLNEQDRKIRQLNSDYNYLKEVNKETVKQCERWKTLYEIKDKEVTARVKRLNEICNQYKYAITFVKDIDPNDAVNILCDRILQTEVEM